MSSKTLTSFDNEDDFEDFLDSVLSAPKSKEKDIKTKSGGNFKNNSQNSNTNDPLEKNYQEILDDEDSQERIIDTNLFPEDSSKIINKKTQNNVLKSSLKNNESIIGEKKVPGKSLISGERKKSILDDLLNFDDEDDWGTTKKEDLKFKSESQIKKSGTLKVDKPDKSKENDDDANTISFGNYTPSISTSNKRQVRFKNDDNDDDDDENLLFLNTAPTSLLSDVTKKSTPDWLGETSGVGATSTNRPNSVESANNKVNSAETDDWLTELTKNKSTPNHTETVSTVTKQKSEDSLIKEETKDLRKEKKGNKNNKFNLDFLDDFSVKSKEEPSKQASPQPRKQPTGNTTNQDLMIEELEQKIIFLQQRVETLQQQHHQQSSYMQDAHDKRMQLAEEHFEKCLETLKQGNQILSRDLTEKFEMVGGERMEGFSRMVKSLADVEKDKMHELMNIRAEYRRNLDEIKQEHDDALQRILQDKKKEIEVMMSGRDQMQKLDDTLTHLDSNKKHLVELENEVKVNVERFDLAMKRNLEVKEAHLTKTEEELKKREMLMEGERVHIRSLVEQLHDKLNQQNQLALKEKEALSRTENDVKSERKGLEESKKEFDEMMRKERADVEQLKSELMKEKTRMEIALDREKMKIEEERVRFEVVERERRDGDEKERNKRMKEDVEMRNKERMVQEKKREVEDGRYELKLVGEKLKTERQEFEREKNDLRNERMKMDELNERLNEGSKECVDKLKELERQKTAMKVRLEHVMKKEQLMHSKSSLLSRTAQELNWKKGKLKEDQKFLIMTKNEVEKNLSESLCSRCGGYCHKEKRKIHNARDSYRDRQHRPDENNTNFYDNISIDSDHLFVLDNSLNTGFGVS